MLVLPGAFTPGHRGEINSTIRPWVVRYERRTTKNSSRIPFEAKTSTGEVIIPAVRSLGLATPRFLIFLPLPVTALFVIVTDFERLAEALAFLYLGLGHLMHLVLLETSLCRRGANAGRHFAKQLLS